jgi:hypothetical protein
MPLRDEGSQRADIEEKEQEEAHLDKVSLSAGEVQLDLVDGGLDLGLFSRQASIFPSSTKEERKPRTSFNNLLNLPSVKLLTPILFTFPLSTSSSIARQVGKTSFVKSQSMMGLPSLPVPEKATGQLRNGRL